jgi:CRISPR-associated protein Cmr3
MRRRENAMTTLILRPHDTLFLRDGRPFNQGDQEQAATGGIFPPHPPTVAGALRAGLARASGWTRGGWPDALKARLGDGVDWASGDAALGPLRFTGPFVLRGEHPLFPAPLCLLVKGAGEADGKVVRLAPGKPLECDLGCVALPEKVGGMQGGKAPEDVWIDSDGLKAVLNGDVPRAASLVRQSALWQTEARVGISRDESTRTTKENALYAAAHIRLADRQNDHGPVALAVQIDGSNAANIIGTLAPLGGEGRSVWIEAGTMPALPAAALAPDADGMLRYTVILLTPAWFGDTDDDWPGPNRPDRPIRDDTGAALPGRVVCACIGKPVPVGGWDSEARIPLPLRPLAPAGSVWFVEAQAGDMPAVLARHKHGIGRATAWGFGLAVIGRWHREGQ